MSKILIMFFLSLFGIIFMVGRKLILIQNGIIILTEHSHPFVPDIQKIKEVVSKNTKKHSYTILVAIIRYYVLFGIFLKSTYLKIKNKIRNKNKENAEQKKISRFLKIISDYKNKIRHIKHQIVEEENKHRIKEKENLKLPE